MEELKPTLGTRRQRREFEARRLHNLLLFVEHARNQAERERNQDTVNRWLRRYLSDFYGLRGRP